MSKIKIIIIQIYLSGNVFVNLYILQNNVVPIEATWNPKNLTLLCWICLDMIPHCSILKGNNNIRHSSMEDGIILGLQPIK